MFNNPSYGLPQNYNSDDINRKMCLLTISFVKHSVLPYARQINSKTPVFLVSSEMDNTDRFYLLTKYIRRLRPAGDFLNFRG